MWPAGAPGDAVPDQATSAHPWAAGPVGDAVLRPADGQRRHTRRLVVVVAAAVIVLVGGGVALLVTTGPGATVNTAAAARSLFRSTMVAAARQRSFHYVSSYTSGGTSQTTIGDAGPSSGRQVITIGTHKFTVLLIGSACYFQGDARELQDQLGLSAAVASAHAGQWISLTPQDQPYPSVSVAVTAGSALASNIAFRPEREVGTSKVEGTQAIGITGAMTNETVNGAIQTAKGTATLFTSAARPHLPVRYTQHGTVNGQAGKFSMTFGAWGEMVSLQAPSSSVPYATLAAGTFTPSPQTPSVLT